MDTKKLRQKILDLAIHGKLVPQDPNDEPASVLLERIRAEKERLIAEGKIKRSKKSCANREQSQACLNSAEMQPRLAKGKSATSDTPHYENVPFEVPEGWVWVSLSEIAHSCLGKMLDKEKNQGTLLPYLRNVNVRWGAFELEDVLQMPFCEEDERFSIVQGDLVVCEGGEPGRCAIWEHKESIKFQKALHRIRCFNGTLNYYIKNVIEWYASSKNIEKYYTGSTIKHLTGESLNTLQIPLPPIQEQHRIVSIIDQWMSLIGLLDTEFAELKQNIEKTKSRILDLAIKGVLVPQDENDEPASELLKRINPKAVVSCDNPHYADIPESWVECKLGEVCTFESGYAYSSELYRPMGIPLIRISNIVDGVVNIEDCVYIKGDELSKNVQVKQGDLLIAMSGATTGKIGIYTYTDDAILNQRVGNIKVKDNTVLSTDYRDLFVNAIKVEIEKKAYGGAQPNISGKMICDFSFSLPPYNEQKRIVSRVKELFSQLDMIEKSLQA